MAHTKTRPETVDLAAGEILFEQGTIGELVYVVEHGEIEVFRRTLDGENVIASIHEGDYFGELGPMLRLPRSATARARVPTTLTGYPVPDFRRLHRLEQPTRS